MRRYSTRLQLVDLLNYLTKSIRFFKIQQDLAKAGLKLSFDTSIFSILTVSVYLLRLSDWVNNYLLVPSAQINHYNTFRFKRYPITDYSLDHSSIECSREDYSNRGDRSMLLGRPHIKWVKFLGEPAFIID